MTTEAGQDLLAQTRRRVHPRCMVCGSPHGESPRLRFVAAGEDRVEAWFLPNTAYEGYPNMLHGGIIATLLDAAMTNCLFARGSPGVTGELTVRYREPVVSGRACCVRGWLERAAAPLFVLRADITQDGRLRAAARGKFIVHGDGSLPHPEVDSADWI